LGDSACKICQLSPNVRAEYNDRRHEGTLKMHPKVILQLYPMLPADGEEGRKRARPVGRDTDLYQRVLFDWLDIIKAADEMGVWGASTIEHHLHSEGYEVGPNPGILNAWWAGQVKHMHVGALGYVMATQDPIRVAEETAILDHITRGKYFVGFARGYQSRWTNILGQFSNTVATVSDGSADDAKNRDIFEERVAMVLRCWEEDSVVLDGNYYQAPFPLDTGVQKYPAARIARAAGAAGEVDAAGNVRRVSVVPPTYKKRRPPIFVATSRSEDSVRYCGRNAFIPTYFSKFDSIRTQAQLYVDEAARQGEHVVLGQRQNIVRWPHIASSMAECDQMVRDYDIDIYKNLYGPFFPQFPTDPNTDFVQNVKESGIFTVGTPDQVRDEWKRLYDEVPCEYITLIYHFAQQPKESVLRELELFMGNVVPHLDAASSVPAVQAAV
jgi:alkanesulfonate monooxygenase SsuD/methylene tetrahydromethanopterin reductase-like flavin-dependent oxidoreductase (luciferase family)